MTSFILMGLKHSGKSTLAGRLAHELRCKFVDLDHIIESIYRADRLVSCRESYQRHGKKYFTALETEAAGKLNVMINEEPLVAALGGGTGENSSAMEQLKGSGTLIYLQDDEQVLYNRIMKRGRPAFLPEDDPKSAFHELFVRRHNLYHEFADHVADVSGNTILDAFEVLRRLLMDQFDGLLGDSSY